MNKTAKDIISAHFSDLGKMGGKAQKKKFSKKQLSEWGKKGGRPRKKLSTRGRLQKPVGLL